MRSAGVAVDALTEYVALFQQGEATSKARKQILIEQRSRLLAHLAELEATLNRLNAKIQNYEQILLPAEEHLRSSELMSVQ